ncbi:MAG: hypothetical protein L0207_04510 [Chlamydiae bacterium]|nr:hypothetical protein [Chlamydiota bacterium]
MTTIVTETEFGNVFLQMNGISSNPLFQEQYTKLLELKERTEATFEKTKKQEDLYLGVEEAIQIIFHMPDARIKSANILHNIGLQLSSEKLRTLALTEAINKFLTKGAIQEAINAVKNIPDEKERSQIFFETIEFAIENDSRIAVHILSKEKTMTEFNKAKADDLLAKIVDKFLSAIDCEEVKGLSGIISIRLIAIAATEEISDLEKRDVYLIKLIQFLASNDLLAIAIEILAGLHSEKCLKSAIKYLTQFLKAEEDVKKIIDSICKFRIEESRLKLMENFAMGFINISWMNYAMQVINSLADKFKNVEELSNVLARISKYLIEKNKMEYFVKVLNKLIALNKGTDATFLAFRKTLLIDIVNFLRVHGHDNYASMIENKQKLLPTS